jgi:hypothetical protein
MHPQRRRARLHPGGFDLRGHLPQVDHDHAEHGRGKPKTIDVGTGTGSATGLFFKGVPIVWDPTFSVLDALEAPLAANLWEKRCYFINTKHLKYEDDDMAIYNPPSPYNVRATYASLDLRCALKTDRRNAHAVIIVA